MGDVTGSITIEFAMLMLVLARFDGSDTRGGATWYEKGMEWAIANGISDGSSPEQNIKDAGLFHKKRFGGCGLLVCT